MNDSNRKINQIEQYQQVLSQFSDSLQCIREEERKRIARELHDDLGQLLAALRMDLTVLQKQHEKLNLVFPMVSSMDLLLATAVTTLRRITADLRPLALEKHGLPAALHTFLTEFEVRYGIQCQLQANDADLILNDTLSATVFRLVQESLSNVARHALASSVTIHFTQQNDDLCFSIKDNGRGILPDDFAKCQSFGLLGMRERVSVLGGDFHIISTTNEGTCIQVRLPIGGSE